MECSGEAPSMREVERTPAAQRSVDADRDSILQFAPLSVDKMSQRRNEVVGPND